MSEIDTVRAWRALFLNEDGSFKDNAETVLRDLEAKCGWMQFSLPVDNEGRADPLRTAAALERRGIFAHVKTRLFGPMDKLVRQEQRNV